MRGETSGKRDAARRAGQPLGEQERRAVHHLDLDHALGELERRLERVGQAGAEGVLDHEAVDHDLDRVLLGLGELDLLGQLAELAVDAHPHVALAPQVEEQLAVLALAPANHRREQDDAAARGQRHEAVDHLLDGLRGDHAAAPGAMRDADPGEEHAQVVVDLGDRPDRRARVLRGGLLLDGDGGRQALDGVDVRLLHLLEELARVGRQRLDVAALALGVDGVEGERGLARAAQPGDDDELVPRDLDVDGLEVVLPRPADDDAIVGHASG